MSTRFAKRSGVERRWYLVDAGGQALGRVAARVARLLMGKDKPVFTPFIDTGDHVVVINAARVILTGKKERDKVYHHHSGYPGGLKAARVEQVRAKHPARLMEEAVRGMLPKSRLGKSMFRKLKVYAGPEHPHQAQKPQPLGG
jgi:large subunit ribosomal protein L13